MAHSGRITCSSWRWNLEFSSLYQHLEHFEDGRSSKNNGLYMLLVAFCDGITDLWDWEQVYAQDLCATYLPTRTRMNKTGQGEAHLGTWLMKIFFLWCVQSVCYTVFFDILMQVLSPFHMWLLIIINNSWCGLITQFLQRATECGGKSQCFQPLYFIDDKVEPLRDQVTWLKVP